jgi:type VI secretion system secreted protein Hcp
MLQGAPMATDIFAKIGDIKGESTDAKHKDEIEVLSFSWGVANSGSSGSGSGSGAGKATFQDLLIVHGIDKATPDLLKACATGLRIKNATITHRKAGKGQQEFLFIKLNDVTITAVSHGGSEDQPYAESVTLKFAKVDLEYKPQRPDGSLDPGLHFKFDLKANKVG